MLGNVRTIPTIDGMLNYGMRARRVPWWLRAPHCSRLVVSAVSMMVLHDNVMLDEQWQLPFSEIYSIGILSRERYARVERNGFLIDKIINANDPSRNRISNRSALLLIAQKQRPGDALNGAGCRRCRPPFFNFYQFPSLINGSFICEIDISPIKRRNADPDQHTVIC